MILLRPIESLSDISPEIRGTPIEDLLCYHNLGAAHSPYSQAEILVGMCMDHRDRLSFPDNFAYIIRSAGCNLRQSEFQISYAVAIGSVSAIALVGHTNCGMVNLMNRRELFISRLVQRGGWQREWAEAHFMNSAATFEIGNEIDFLVAEARRLRGRYPAIPVVPLIYRVEDRRLYHVNEQWVPSDATGGVRPLRSLEQTVL